tara:strand:- start:55 stop:567 length:513 start_codon:yes stop_codon:yes gene_type:complete
MKFVTIILLSILSLCSNGNNKPNSEKDIVLSKTNTEPTIEKLKKPELIGKWYSSYLNFDDSLTFSKNINETKGSIQYEFSFMENGEIKFKDLTENYICGLGILKINNGTWKIHHENYLTVTLAGEFTGDYSFEKEIQYEIIASKESELNLRLDNINKSCEVGYGGTVFID